MASKGKLWRSALLGIWLGAAVCVPLGRHLTIPPMPWLFELKMATALALIMSAVIVPLFAAIDRAEVSRGTK